MPNPYTISVSPEVEKALKKKSAEDGISEDELIQLQLEYYIACALYKHFEPNSPINTPKLSIVQRLEVYAVMINEGEEAARAKVIELQNI